LALAQFLPVPTVYPGHVLGSGSIVLEEFMDFQCPDCQTAWPVIQQVLASFPSGKIKYIQHLFPLWSHRQAFDTAKAGEIVSMYANNSASYWSFVDYVFTNQAQIYNLQFYNRTENDLYALLQAWTGKFGVSASNFLAGMGSEQVYDVLDADIHLGILTQVYGTPTFVVNGFKVPFDETTTVSQWVEFLKSLL